jgi:hypothetical protein
MQKFKTSVLVAMLVGNILNMAQYCPLNVSMQIFKPDALVAIFCDKIKHAQISALVALF